MKSGEIVANKYLLKALLGAGGMGEVWSAIHTSTDRDFAIKFMHAHVASPEMTARFAREAKASARINHPNIIDVFDVGQTEDGHLYLVMEMLDGVPLADAFYASPPLNVREFLALILDATKALAAAHAVGIFHRDIKPANIFLHRERGTGMSFAKVLDFGISKFSANDDSLATKTGSVLGSPRYMSPEQARSAAGADHRADIWALGVIMFEGLTGFWPHDGDSFSSLVIAIATSPPHDINMVVPNLPVGLRALVNDCLLPMARRIQTCEDLARRIEQEITNGDLGAIPLPRPNHGPAGDSKTSTGSIKVRTPKPLTGTGSDRVPGMQPLVTATGAPNASQPSFAARIDQAPQAMRPPAQRTAPFPAAGMLGVLPPPQAPPPSQHLPPRSEQTATQAWSPPGAIPMGPPSRPRDGLSESVSAMNIETIAVSAPLDQSRPPMPGPPMPPAISQMMPAPLPRPAPDTSASKLGLVAAALGVLTLGIGIAIFTVVRGGPAAAASATPAGEPPAAPPAATASAAIESPPAEPSAAPSTKPSASPTASAAARAPSKGAPGPQKPPPPPKKKIGDLGSGL